MWKNFHNCEELKSASFCLSLKITIYSQGLVAQEENGQKLN